MSRKRSWGERIQGMGAHWAGQGQDYERMRLARDQAWLQEQEKRQAELKAKEDKTAQRMAYNIRQAREYINAGDPMKAKALIDEIRQGVPGAENSKKMQGLNRELDAVVSSMNNPAVAMSPNFDPQKAMSRISGQLDAMDKSFVGRGYIAPSARSEYTLAPGAQRWVNGKMVAENPVDPTTSATGHNRASAVTRVYDNGTTLKVFPDGSDVVTNPAGEVVTGQDRLSVLRTARQEQIDFARNRAEAAGYGEGSSERVNQTITNGLDVATSVGTLRRGIDLLDQVKTGGWESVGIRARSLFGVEGADEGELSANLGQAILSQLRPIFGAQFTEREGARLERISAGLGRNSETNKRLLNQLLTIVERDANLAIDAAISIRDFRTAQEIQELLDFRLTDETGTNGGVEGSNLSPEDYQELIELREWFREQ